MSLSDAQEGLGGKVKEEEEKERLTMNDSPIMDACIYSCVYIHMCSVFQRCRMQLHISTPQMCVLISQSVQRDSLHIDKVPLASLPAHS